MILLNANPQPHIEGVDELPGTVNYFLGNDPAAWRANIPTYAKVKYHEVYRGVDLIYYGNQRQLEYDYVVSPGADPGVITLGFEGVDRLEVSAEGDLVAHIGNGEVRWRRPLIYQEIAGSKQAIPGGFVLRAPRQIGFRIGAYDANQPLIIDPILVYSTYLGGSGDDQISAMTADASGNVYVTGYTMSANFPTLNAYRATPVGSSDVFVTKLNPSGTALIYSTYLGGVWDDDGHAIAVDSGGNACITGETDSSDFPTRNAKQPTFGGDFDAFITKLGPYGTNLLYSSYLGGSGYESGNGVAVDGAGMIYVVGETDSGPGFPKQSPFQNNSGGAAGSFDAFVAKYNPSLSGSASYLFASWLGGGDNDRALAVALDASTNICLIGEVDSFDYISASFPTVNPFQPLYGGGGYDAFVAKVNSQGTSVIFASYLGGDDDDYSGYGVATDSQGNIYIAGETYSANFPVTNAAQAVINGDGQVGSRDAFVTKITSNGSALRYSTFLGGSVGETAWSVAVDNLGFLYVVGETSSTDFPATAGAQQTAYGGGAFDAFFAKLNPNASGPPSLVYASYLGGSGDDWANDVAVNTSGDAYLAGLTSSTNFPISSTRYDGTYNGGTSDGFIARVSPPADLSVSGGVAPNPVPVYNNVTNSLLVANNGRTAFSGVVVTSQLPAILTFVSASSTKGTVSAASGVVTCNIGGLTNAEQVSISIIATANAPGSATNLVALSAVEAEPNTQNNNLVLISAIRGYADLALTLTESPNPVLISSNLVYTVGITNKGPWPATAVVFTNTLPSQVAFVSANSTTSTQPVNSAGTVTCELGSLGVGAGAVITITAKAVSTGNATNTASVSTFDIDPVPLNNSTNVPTTINPLAEPSISMSVTPAVVPLTRNTDFVLAVSNAGPSSASSVFVTNRLPAGFTYVTATGTQGSFSQTSGVVTWNIGTLAASNRITATITAQAVSLGFWTNKCELYSATTDWNTGNNTNTAVVQVIPQPNLTLTKSTALQTVRVADPVTFTLTITNRSTTPGSAVTVTDPIPVGLQYVSAVASQGPCVFSSGAVVCSIGTLSNNALVTVSLATVVTAPGNITNTATATCNEGDSAPADNTASATLTVEAFRLNVAASGTNIVLSWPTNAAGYVLQAKTNLATNLIWTVVSGTPYVVSNRYVHTNPATGSRQFFRLAK